MKKIYLLIILFCISTNLTNAQVGIGTTNPDPTSELDVSSTLNNKGVLIPRMTEAQKNAITSPATSLLVYQTNNTPGFYYYDGSTWVRVTAGSSTDWTLLGNAGTTTATNFIGTTDDVDVVLRRNNVRAGFIGSPNTTSGNRNTSFGANTLLAPTVTTGIRNTAIGTNNMTNSTSGSLNVSIGDSAMSLNTTGFQNTAVGTGALFSNSTNNSNTAIGRNALTASTANFNTAVGHSSLVANTTGTLNSAIGVNSLFKNTTGNNNTADGVQALRSNTTGSNNTALGYQALSGNPVITANESTYGNSTAVGYQSFFNNLIGSGNVGLGFQSGFSELGGNKLYIENSNADANNALIYGEFDTNILRTNSTFQIGNPTITGYAFPATRPATLGSQILQYSAAGTLTFQTPSAALNNFAWLTTGNSALATNFIGTTNAQALAFRTSNIERMRISTAGDFSVGTGTPIAGNKITAFATGAQQAVRGESTLAGIGVIGFNTGTGIGTQGQNSSTGAGVFGVNTGTGVGAQGQSTNLNGTALVGINNAGAGAGNGFGMIGQTSQNNGVGVLGFNNGPAGTSFGWLFGGSRASVFGNANPVGSFAFGVMGDGGTSVRSGGIFGDDFGVARGALGYFASSFNDFAVYGFGTAYETGIPGGRFLNGNSSTEPNNMIGIGIYGGVMGGWIRGINYGLHVKGNEYGMYVDGNTITNKPIIQLIENGNEKRTISFVTSSMTADVYVRGNAQLTNGTVYINFNSDYSSIVSDKIPLNITVTPNGESKGVYVTDISTRGFRVVENGNGTSNVSINWVSYGSRIGYDSNENIISDEIISSKFDQNMNDVMYNDSNNDGTQKGIWFDGTKVKTGQTPASIHTAKLNKKKTKAEVKIQTFEIEKEK